MSNDNELPRYPRGAGFRDDDASKDGARKVNRDGSRLSQCAFALAVVEQAGPEGIGSYAVFRAPGATWSELAICRARLSDLKKQGKIAKKGERTPGEAGVAVNLWIAARYVTRDDGQGDLFGEAA
ncbi:hypothetical protein BWQ93_01665 [Sphingopyxis sp. QXT-31]|uniref:hypothetical protein n=1 Tax=Sphingopyxis sp. QXT-31 TaxID=1357916 RepID=UPI00097965B8|nr:hypothetical protein [Sphingopyxis sp. QXT-31]APZ97341.1 hypothetical protein BWQ93_01665 [Sphingopyxis sp. QXT-31]